MALRSLVWDSFTPTAVADTTNIADKTYVALQGGSATQKGRIEEIYMGGQAGSSSVNCMIVARDSTVGITLSKSASAPNLTDAPLDAAAVALATVLASFNTATTKPQRSAANYLANLTFNSFGGVVRWVTSPNEVGLILVGTAVNLGEISLSDSSATGTPGAIGGHVYYEPY